MDRALSEFTDVREVNSTANAPAAWVARDRGTDKPVLIKRLNGTGGRTRATQALGLSHPNVVATRRWFFDSRALYIVRDWIEGQNLRSLLAARRAQSFDHLRDLLDPLLDVVEYAHASGVSHGAITPENIVFDAKGSPFLTDFAVFDPRNGARTRYISRQMLSSDGKPTPRSDYYALYELYKEFLPGRDDEAGVEARNRIIRNLSEAQLSTATPDELRYKLDAITRMADLLGFGENPAGDAGPVSMGPRLLCQLSPPTALVTPGSGSALILTIWNEGDQPLRIENVTSDVVWINPQPRFEPITLNADDELDLVLTVSAARLQPGAYATTLTIHSNTGMAALAPPSGEAWDEQTISLPVLVQGTPSQTEPKPLAERLPLDKVAEFPLAPNFNVAVTPPARPVPATPAEPADKPGIACIQEPDPGVIQYGQKGVLHVGVRNIGDQKLRIDRVSTSPAWLTYPGEFQPVWIEPGAAQYLGFSVAAGSLTVGDYKATVTFVTSLQEDTELGHRTVWREMKCEVRVRVMKDGAKDRSGGGCATAIVSLFGIATLLAGLIAALH